MNGVLQIKWSRYIHPNHYPHKKQIAFLALPHEEALYGGAAYGGKLLSRGGILLTPFGWKKCEDLKVGDRINNPDGSISRIIQLKPWVKLPKWTVHFEDGTSTDVAEEHLWLSWRTSKRKKMHGKGSFGSASAEVITTRELKEWCDAALKQQAEGKRPNWPLIPICKPQRFNVTHKYPAILCPYLLGALLGDGCITDKSTVTLTCSTEDYEHWRNELNLEHRWCPKKSQPTTGSMYFRGVDRDFIAIQLRKLKLQGCNSHTKFIPRQYLMGSLKDRIKLLQGLMDTDGYIDHRGQLYYCSVSERLRQDVCFLVRSLGGTAKVFGEHDIYITLPYQIKPFRLKRKLARHKPMKRELNKKVIRVEVGGEIEGRCLSVSHPNGLYITNDFIVTHNSDVLLMGALQYFDVPGYKGIIFRRSLTDHKLPDSILSRAKEWLAPFVARKEVRWSHSENTFYSREGGMLAFGYMDKEEDEKRYDSTQFQYCVAKGTKVLMEGGFYKRIEEIRVGDLVQTLEGPKPVTRVHPPRRKFCVKIRGQIQGWDHRIFSDDQNSWLDYGTLASRQFRAARNTISQTEKTDPFLGQTLDTRLNHPLPLYVSAGLSPSDFDYSRDFFAWLASGQTDSEEFDGGPPALQRLPRLYVPVRLYEPSAHQGRSSSEDDCVLWPKEAQDFEFGYHNDYRSYGERVQLSQGYASQSCPPSLNGAAKQSPHCLLLDDSGSIPSRIHRDRQTHIHPYTSELRWNGGTTVSSLDRIEPFGFSEVYDITVGDASHYITESQLVNSNCAYDELTHFTEKQYVYLFSRIRRTPDLTCYIPLRMRAGTNPGGRGHGWVKRRWRIEKDEDGEFRGHDPERPFIQAKVDDNPTADAKAYIRMLEKMDPVTRDRLKNGDWSASEEAVYKDRWFEQRYRVKSNYYSCNGKVFHKNELFIFATTDVAGSERAAPEGKVLSKTSRSQEEPSWSVEMIWGMTPDFELILLDVFRSQCHIPRFVYAAEELQRKWQPAFVRAESNSINLGFTQALQSRGILVHEVPSVNDKLVRATPAILMAEKGRIWLPETAEWLPYLEDELWVWQGLKGEPSDQIDCISLAGSYAAQASYGRDIDGTLAQGVHQAKPSFTQGLFSGLTHTRGLFPAKSKSRRAG